MLEKLIERRDTEGYEILIVNSCPNMTFRWKRGDNSNIFLNKLNCGGIINQTSVHSNKGIKLDSILFLIVYICRNKMIPNTCIFRLLTLAYYQVSYFQELSKIFAELRKIPCSMYKLAVFTLKVIRNTLIEA
jgi:hypothetical protein